MNDFVLIALGAGLQDGLSPCNFITCSVFILLGFLSPLSALQIVWLRVVFVLTYVFNALLFNFGPGQLLILRKDFIFSAKYVYFILGLGAFILGVLFLRDWFLLIRGKKEQPLFEKKIGCSAVWVSLTIFILTAALSSLASLWPISNYVLLLGNEGLLKGQWEWVIPFLLGYVLVCMWPIWFVWALISVKNLRPSLLKIICAIVFFTASSSMILIFK